MVRSTASLLRKWLMDHSRSIYLEAAHTALKLLQSDETAARWNDDSVLGGMTVGVLASYLARSILQVGWFLDGDLTGQQPPFSATIYYARLSDTSSRTSALNAGVEQRSAETAMRGPEAIADETRIALQVLETCLSVEPADRRVAIAHRPGEELLLDEYLCTRLVEIAVHTEDLALSIDADCVAPPCAVTAAVDLLLDAARIRHGDTSVLHALARRERDDKNALRVL
ncbi:maleylpyruvate isomerase N-terminal domain-containing protein [Frigoribacterium sp. UYMn621]|uniref:maleylpyruvate isomerase N-terminal domain-containing protein n=1 Tax=Frigoribacterium sp. UYMn621 TaxID=3156343 RepID=UPI0033920E62